MQNKTNSLKRIAKEIGLCSMAAASLFLGSCSLERKQIVKKFFQDEAYYYLVNVFEKKGLCNTKSPFFDFNDLMVRESYEQAKSAAKPRIIKEDLESNRHIEETVKKHLGFYRGRSLIIISGAGFHIWGATKTLENRFNAEYISVAPKKLNLKRFANGKEVTREQFTRALEVVKYLGYDTLEDYFEEVSDFNEAKNIVVGIEETGIHAEYKEEDFNQVYNILTDFIHKFHPRSILYFRENLFFENNSHKRFLNKTSELRIPVELASFGAIDI